MFVLLMYIAFLYFWNCHIIVIILHNDVDKLNNGKNNNINKQILLLF